MLTSSSRRAFLKSSALAVAGAVVLPNVSSTEAALTSQALVPIVDTHQHLWDLKKFRLPWLQNGGPEELNRSFVMADYRKATKGLNVVKTVYMEVNVAADQQAQEAAYVLDLCARKDNPMVAAVIGGSPQEKGFPRLMPKAIND